MIIIKKKKWEKEMATHSSILAWKSPWIEEPGRLQSMGLHDCACVHEGGRRWVSSNKVVELKKKKKQRAIWPVLKTSMTKGIYVNNTESFYKSKD